MTPAQRVRLAAALTQATGQDWFVAMSRPARYMLALDGAARDTPSQLSIVRAGHTYLLTPDPRGWPYCRRIDIGNHVGRGWLDRLVVDAVRAIRDYDAHGPRRPMTAREVRRRGVYEAILRPSSGACESERLQAQRWLVRMGVVT